MKISKQLYVYAVIDKREQVYMEASSNAANVIHFRGLIGADGWDQDFHDQSFLLPDFCRKQGFQCIVTIRTIEIEFPE